MKPLCFKPLKGFRIFSKIFESGYKFYTPEAFCVVLFRQSGSNQEQELIPVAGNDTIYIGVSAGKRVSKKAVIRNRIKRLLRVSIRAVAEEVFQEGHSTCIETIIIIWKIPVQHPQLIKLPDVLPVVRRLITRANSYYNGKIAGK